MGRSFEEHLQNLQLLLFATESVGHIVSIQGIMLDSKKTSKVEEWPVPNTVQGIHNFRISKYYT